MALVIINFMSFFNISSARTHVSYEVKGDVAVVRVNDPNAKVIILSANRVDLSIQITAGVIMSVFMLLLLYSGKHTVCSNAKGYDRSYG